MFELTQWAIRHGVSHVALADLKAMLQGEADDLPEPEGDPLSESYIQSAVRLEAANKGIWLMRNNVGACQDKSGRLIRYGLSNDSKQMNKRIKSADLVGIKPILITQEMVGSTIGQFFAPEIKESAWSYSGDEHEQAQQRWGAKVISMGGAWKFINKVGVL
jgi:hypothetical protein